MITLNSILKANAASCVLFGCLFLAIPMQVSLFLSPVESAPVLLISILGGVLLFNGLHLLWASLQKPPHRLLVLYFSFGDLLWVLMSAALLFTETWITTLFGIMATFVVAIAVGLMGALQWRSVQHSENSAK